MSETPVDDVTTPTRNANASSVAIVKRITTPDEQEARMDDVRLPDHDQPHRADQVDEVGRREQQAAGVAREEQRHAADRTREVEVDRALLLEARHQVRGREEGEERPDEVEESREAGLEAEHELVELDRAVADVDGVAEELRAGERAVDDVEVDGAREDQDEERRQREVGDQRPARRGLAEDLLRRSRRRPSRAPSFPGSSPGPDEIDEDVLEARADRRELLQLRAAGPQPVDERRSGGPGPAPSGRSGR